MAHIELHGMSGGVAGRSEIAELGRFETALMKGLDRLARDSTSPGHFQCTTFGYGATRVMNSRREQSIVAIIYYSEAESKCDAPRKIGLMLQGIESRLDPHFVRWESVPPRS